jgi:hypothetical protein
MLYRILPTPATNVYRGHPLAKWVFVVLTLITLGRSLVHMFAADGGAQSIASVRLDAFSTAGANSVVTMFGLWGLSQLIIGMLYVGVIWRYQSLIPLMYICFSFEYLMRLIAPVYTPGLALAETAPGAVGNFIFLPLGLVMLWLSLREASEAA